MHEFIAKNARKLVVQEINRWHQDRLISNEIVSQLLALYPDKQSSNNIIGILMTIGAVLIGLGMLLFIASNWLLMPTFVKIVMIIGAIASAQFGGWYFKFQPGNRPKLGSSLLLLGAILYGAGIWLISQIYNLDTELSQGLLIWALGVFPLALIARTLSLGVLSVTLAAAWSLSSSHALFGLHVNDVQKFSEFILAFSSCILLSHKLRSRWCLTLSLMFGATWIGLNSSQVGLLAIGVAFMAAYLLHEKHQQYFAPYYLLTGLIVTLGALTFFTLDTGAIEDVDRIPSLIVWISALVSLAAVTVKRKDVSADVSLLGALLLSGLVPLCTRFGTVQALVSNAVLLGVLLVLMFFSSNRHKSETMLNTAVVFLVIDIVCRYFDVFFQTIDRSLFFVTGGFIFLIAATVLEHNRRKLLEGFTK